MRYFAFIVCLTVPSWALAGTYKIPEEDPIVTVKVSDKWKTQEHEEFLETVSPDGNANALVLPVEGNKVAECMSEAIRHIRLRGGVMVKTKSIKQETAKLNERDVPTVSWDATDHGRPMKIRCYVFTGRDQRRVIIMTWGAGEIEKKNAAELTRMLETIRTH